MARAVRPFRVAVVGSGPAGFYTAHKVMSRIETCKLDMYESLPVPYGLVRFGVAPDHPEVKNCQEKFDEVASSANFNFIGNISVGADLPLSTMKPHYDAIVLAYGASKDRQLGIPGETTLKGIYSARAFVGWYNGLPEYADLAPDLELGEDAVIIGQGNVALDVARALLTGVDILRKTDMTEYAIEALSRSRVKRVKVVGRRGPMQAAFTIREVRELMDLRLTAFHQVDSSLLPSNPKILPRAQQRLAQLLQRTPVTPMSEARNSWELCSLLSPTSFQASSAGLDHLSSIIFARQTFPDNNPFDLKAKVSATTETISLPASLAFRSIGYKSEPLPGLADLDVSFDEERGIIPSDLGGRVLADPQRCDGARVPGMYTSGWAKCGPTGVIASTMNDAFLTAESIAQDKAENLAFLNGRPLIGGSGSTGLGWDGVRAEVQKRGLRPVNWREWKVIDKAEMERGQRVGKEREKIPSVKDMLRVLDCG